MKRWRSWKHDILTGLGFFILAGLAARYTRFDNGVAFIWPANAMLATRLITLAPGLWWGPLAASAIGSLLATTLCGLGWQLAPGLALGNLTEAACAAAALRAMNIRRFTFDSPGWMTRFVAVTGLVAPVAGALVLRVNLVLVAHRWNYDQSATWFVGHGVGLILFMPLFAGVHALIEGRAPTDGEPFFPVGLAALGMTIFAVPVFAQTTLPILYLPVLFLAVSAVWATTTMLVAMCIALALVATTFTALGTGPIALMPASFGGQMHFVQFYLATTVLSLTPIAGAVQRLRRLYTKFRESEARYRLLAENSGDVIMSTAIDGTVTFVSPSILEVANHRPEDLVGRSARVLVAPEHLRRVAEMNALAVACPGRVLQVEFMGMPRGCPPRWFQSRLQGVPGARGKAESVVSVLRDISHEKAAQEALARDALTDPLTGLANRRQFEIALRAAAEAGTGGCLALFDLDHFKRVNDSFGHAAGDTVLQAFAAIARQGLRSSDTLARFGGEEFALLLPGASIETAEMICGRLGAKLSQAAIEVGQARIVVTTSIGLAPLGPDPLAAMASADRALYEAKGAGRDRLAVAA